ncbi:HAMP domain-containing histidine kinase [Candidatus Nomurabacteria bacterium]|nr:HAMP domain-containing histidine kinase [Candidatus Nomurabacteria bacterium]
MKRWLFVFWLISMTNSTPKKRSFKDLLKSLLWKLGFKFLSLSEVEEMERKLAKLEQIAFEFNVSTKLLIRRDLELSRANEKLQKFDEIKSNFISVVAHQLRTPLSGIKWTLSMLINGDMGVLNDTQKTFLMKSYESNARMIALVNDMLIADGIQSEKVHYVSTYLNIIDLMDSVFFEMSSQALKRNISIRYKNKFENLPQVYVDPVTIRAVLQNLLENAIKYIIDNGVIEIDVKKENNYLVISIADNGIGIPKDQHKDIFLKFFRASNAIKQQTDGSGLGLYIAKNIVEKNGGTIWFDSILGKGSTFYFTIPLSENHLKDDDSWTNSTKSEGGEYVESTSSHSRV